MWPTGWRRPGPRKPSEYLDSAFVRVAHPGSQLRRSPPLEERPDLARVDISMSSDVDPETAWKLACDRRRFDEWMTIFGGWRGRVPSTIEEGTRASSCIRVKGFRNVIRWEVTGTRSRNRLSCKVAVEPGSSGPTCVSR